MAEQLVSDELWGLIELLLQLRRDCIQSRGWSGVARSDKLIDG
jgi:hypothetical protein